MFNVRNNNFSDFSLITRPRPCHYADAFGNAYVYRSFSLTHTGTQFNEIGVICFMQYKVPSTTLRYTFKTRCNGHRLHRKRLHYRTRRYNVFENITYTP